MKIFVSGAYGFTGRHFVHYAEMRGHTVWCLDADLTDKAALVIEVAEAKPDAVVHLGAISFVGHGDSSALYAVNVVGSLNLLEAIVALGRPVRRVLLASSANIYGNCLASPIAESQAPAPVNHYAASKLAMEHLARTYYPQLPLVITRPFNYTGPGQGSEFLVPKFVRHFAAKAARIELGNLDVRREFNDVRMVCEAYLRLLEVGRSGETYNICTGWTYSLRELFGVLAQLSGHEMAIDVNPALIRANEVHQLCGNPSKLLAEVGSLPEWRLQDTLGWMLESVSGT
jgi:nucleoside-diphosphate-sugar epimerase